MGKALLSSRLPHGWRLLAPEDTAAEMVRDFIRPAVQAIPRAIAARLGRCRIRLTARLENRSEGVLSSRWAAGEGELDIVVATAGISFHDAAMEMLLCVGQALRETAGPAEREAYWKLLGAEMEAGATGEIDEDALRDKRRLLQSRAAARSRRRLERYATASFAGTAAEYIHCLWHEVTVRRGLAHLPERWLRRRLETFARWFPPNAGYRLYPRTLVRQSSR